MEQQINSWLLGFITVTVTLIIAMWVKDRSRTNKSYKLPPGSTGLPFIGETISLYRGIRSPLQPRQFFDDRQRRYGPVFRSSLLGKSETVVSADPQFNKFVLSNEGRLFQSKYPTSFAKLLGKHSLLAAEGEMQRKLHGTAVNLMSYERLSCDFMEVIQELFREGMNKWEEKREIHLQDECHHIVLNLMAKQLLDLSPSQGKEMEGIYSAFEKFTAAAPCIPLNIPGFTYAKGLQAREYLIKMIYKCMEERRHHPEVVRNDLLTKLLKGGMFSDEIIADFILFLLFAGFETSSRAMTFAVKFLTDNPRALEELRAEHEALLNTKGSREEMLTWNDYLSMNFTHCVVKETLRLGSVSPCVVRETTQDVKWNDFVIPKDWRIMVFLYAMHLDEKSHFNALTFDPWRWQNESQEMEEDPSFMPFGRGARLCPGSNLARLEIALFLHYFVTKFRWEQLQEDHITYFPVPGFVNHLPIRLYSRE